MQKIIVISGPTGVGKTDLVEAISSHINCEIINVDVGAFYTPLNIGTAKQDLHKTLVPYHLFNIFNDPDQYTVADFRKKAQQLIREIHQRGKIPVFVGGSVFYIQSLFYTYPEIQGIDTALIEKLEEKSSYDLWQELAKYDIQRAHKIHPHDHYRLVRALSIYYGTGKKPSDFSLQFEPLGDFYTIFLYRDRPDLYERINNRTKSMLMQGWIEEVQTLQNTQWQDFLMHKKIIGYDIILQYLQRKMSFDTLELEVAQSTRNYAKRQITFLKKMQKQLEGNIFALDTSKKPGIIAPINLTLYEHGLYIKHLLNSLKTFI